MPSTDGIHHDRKVKDIKGPTASAWIGQREDRGFSRIPSGVQPDRSFAEAWGKSGSEDGQFRTIEQIDFDAAGDLCVLEGSSSRPVVQRFRFGAPNNPFLSPPVRDGTRLQRPKSIACGPFGGIWVWDAKTAQAVLFVQE